MIKHIIHFAFLNDFYLNIYLIQLLRKVDTSRNIHLLFYPSICAT